MISLEMTRAELGLGAEDEDIEILKKTYDDTSHDTDESLIRTGRLFGGLILDIKRKSKWFISDFKDALHMQSLAAIIYIYLATITKAITFGGFLGDITDRKQVGLISTVWKFQDFSVIQILREFSFGESKTAVFASFRALNFVNLLTFSFQKCQNS